MIKKLLFGLVFISAFYLSFFIVLPSLYLRYEIRNKLEDYQVYALTRTDQEVRANFETFVRKLNRNLSVAELAVQRGKGKGQRSQARVSLSYYEPIVLSLLGKDIELFRYRHQFELQ